MALSPTLINKLSLIKSNLYEVSEGCLSLTEPMHGNGEDEKNQATVNILLKGDYICIRKLEGKNTAKFFLHQCCADFLIFELIDSNNNFKLHILEFKRTVRNEKNCWPKHITDQFMGGYIHALAIAGYLNINIVNTDVYTCYRNDYILSAINPVAMRVVTAASAQQNKVSATDDIDKWLGHTPVIIFDKDNKPKIAHHKRIPVDENFHATYSFLI